MTTAPPNSIKSESTKENPNSLIDNKPLNLGDNKTIPEVSLNSPYDQENESDDDLLGIADISQSSTESKQVKSLISYFNTIYLCLGRFFLLIFNMISSDINTIITFSVKYFPLNQQRITKKILSHLLLFIVLIVALVHSRTHGSYRSFENHRLFPQHSLITDFFQGELSLLREELLQSDMTIVMYYAPWDRDCQNFVPHFLKAAKYYHEQVSFASINCWLPRSECKGAYKFLSYPVIVLHVQLSTFDELLSISYNGPLSAHHLIRFISQALQPFIHIHDETELFSIQLQHQVIVLGYYEVNNFSRELLSFYYAALSKLQYEHLSGVKYALITDPALAKRCSFNHSPSIHLITWNTTLALPDGMELNSKNISNFVESHLSEVLQWLHISGRKSLALNRVFQQGPFMVLFSPDNPYHTWNDPFQLVRSVALEYHSCQLSALQLWLLKHFFPQMANELREWDKMCRDYVKNHFTSPSSWLPSQQTHVNYLNEHELTCKMKNYNGIDEKNFLEHISWNKIWNSFIDIDSIPFARHWFRSTTVSVCTNNNASSTESKPREIHPRKVNFLAGPNPDDRISKMMDWSAEERCRKLVLRSSVPPPSLILERKPGRVNIEGLACRTNRTLKFVVVDSHLHEDFAHQFGLNLNDATNKQTGAVIVDPEMEERYLLQQPLSRNNVATFVYNFTHNLLVRGELQSKGRRGVLSCPPGAVCIQELDSSTYKHMISHSGQATVILHYTHHCGACSAIAHAILTCQHHLSGVANISFARIDVSKNTLPWHLNFESVPTIIFYPNNDQSQSRIFDSRIPPTVKNLMSFILIGLRPAERNSLALKLCNGKCLKEIRSESLLMRLKLYHSIGWLKLRLRGYNSIIFNLDSEFKQNSQNFSLFKKYHFYLDAKSLLNKKIFSQKLKLSHLNQMIYLYRNVPLEISNKLSSETKSIKDEI